jgi:amino acid adenylation domain-containing protein
MTIAVSEGFRLSAAQRRIWFFGRQGAVARALCAIDVEGDVAAGGVRRAAQEVVRRHETLRTAFVLRPGMKVPFQQIADRGDVDWWEEDLTGFDDPRLQARLEALAAAEMARPIEPEGGTPLRIGWLTTGPGRVVLLVSLPALCADAASLRRILGEMAALACGQTLDEEPLQYVDIAEWQNELLEAEDDEAERGKAYWDRQAAAVMRPYQLPFELPAAAVGSETRCGIPAAVPVALDGGILSRITAVAARYEVSRPDVLRATWWSLLRRLGAASSLAVGELFEGREGRDGDPLLTGVGPVSRWIPLQAEVGEGDRFHQVLQRLARTRAQGESWQHYFAGPRENQGGPAAIGFEPCSWPVLRLPGGTFAVRWCRVASDLFKIRLACLDRQEDLRAEIVYDPSRLPASDVERLSRQFHILLDGALEDPELRVGELRLVSDGEAQSLLSECRGGGALTVDTPGVHRRFERWAAQTPEAPALVVQGLVMTYRRLNERANRLGRLLRRMGVGPDVPVALYLERSQDLMVGMLAILKAGGAYVPFDTSQPERRLAMMLEEVPVPVVVTQADLMPRLPGTTAAVLCVDDHGEAIARESEHDLEGGALPENMAYLIFTSGSTGRPKAVAVEHRQLSNYVDGVRQRLELEPGWSYASVSTFAADLGNTSVFSAFTTGGCLHLISQAQASDSAAMAEYFEQHPIDCLKIVPTHLEALQASSRPERLLPRRRLVVGGEASQRAWSEELRLLAGECRVFNHYGPTETTVGVLTYPLQERVDPRCTTLPIGRPIPNTAAYVLDPCGRPVSVWEPGELFIGGDSVSRGYYGRPDLTAERFVPDPFSAAPGMRLYRTGDVVRLFPEGTLEFRGRRDHQIKFHGFRVELNEIRSALNAHPQIRDSVILPSRDQGGSDLLVAYYVSRQELEFDPLRTWLAQTLIEEVVPNLFVHLRKLPLTLNGKVNYRALPNARRRARR